MPMATVPSLPEISAKTNLDAISAEVRKGIINGTLTEDIAKSIAGRPVQSVAFAGRRAR